MRIKGIGILSAAVLLAPGLAQAAEPLPWTFIEGAYSQGDGNDLTGDSEAYAVKASVGFLEKWHAQLEYVNGETKYDLLAGLADDLLGASIGDFETDGYQLVIGAHPQITDRTQLRTDLTYFDFDGDISARLGDGDGPNGAANGNSGRGRTDVKGYGVGFGLRHAFSPKLEGTIQAWYVEGDIDASISDGVDSLGVKPDFNETMVEIQGRYNWTTNLSVGLTVGLGGLASSMASNPLALLGLGGDVARFDVRWSFGNNGLTDL